MYRVLLACIASLILIIPKLAYATFPDISGTYSGTISGSDSSCTNPADDGPFTGTLTLTLQGSTTGTITGGSGTFVDFETEILTVTGDNNTDTNFFITFDTDDGQSISIDGTFTANALTITSASSSPDPVDGCQVTSGSGTLFKTGGGTTVVSTATPSSSVTDALLFNIQVQNTVQGISTRIGGALSSIRAALTPRFTDNQFKLDGATGLNAGDGTAVPYGVWGNYSYTDFENDLSSTAFDGSSHGFLGGIDFQVWEGTVLGVAFGYDNSDIDTGFNAGNQDTDTITIAPYFGAVLSDVLSLDFNIGYSYVDYDQYRTAGITRVNSSPSADRWFGAFNLNAITFHDRWILGGRVGMLYASSVIDDYTESNGTLVAESRTRVGTFSVAGDVAYSFNEWEPFLNLSYQYDYQLQEVVATTGPQPSNDKDDILLTTGVRYFEKSGVSGNLEYSKRLTRDDYDEDRISLTVRIDY